ncbi:MAG: molybdopterin-guanine dinucleotide biosynthesis protein B [Chloroflexi bacterium]|nr:molybdopterin-guanine dinucleotide biosynthesis protein B [Chloroflexota bacterium]
MSLPVIAIVGPSNSGKTRVAEAIILRLVAQELRVAAVKHCPHGHQVDKPGSDSARLFAAGATRVLMSSPGQLTTIERTEADMTLEEVAVSLDPGYDLLVAEGFKSSTVPKVLVLGAEEVSPLPQQVIAVVSDQRVSLNNVPHYSFQQMDALADEVQRRILREIPKVPAFSLQVDGAPIALAPFPAKALASVILGFLKALKDVPPKPRRVRIVLGGGPIPSKQRKPSGLRRRTAPKPGDEVRREDQR